MADRIFRPVLNFFKRRWLLILIALIILTGIAFYFKNKSDTAAKKIAPYTVKRQNLTETLTISGEIAASESAVLKFQTSGYLTWVGVKEGDYVQKYQTLAALDSDEVKKTMQKYLNTYMDIRWDYETTKDTSGDSAAMTTAVRRVFEQAQFDLNNAVLDVELKNLAIKYSSLWTPIEGIVTSIDTPNAGVNITPTTAQFSVVNPKTIYFSASADQTEITGLKISMPAEIVLDAFPNDPIWGEITSLAFIPKVGETGTVYEVKISLPVDNTNYLYRMSMTGDVNFTLREKKNVLTVPDKYIKSEKDVKYVWLKTADGKKVKQIVTVGLNVDADTEITDGLKEKDIIYESQ